MENKQSPRSSDQIYNAEGEPLSTEWTRHLINLWQSPEERKEKYWLVKSLGGSQSQANRM